MENYGRKLRMEADIRKKKVEKTTESAKRMKKVQKKARVVLRKAWEEMKQQVNRVRIKTEEWKKRIELSTKDLVFKKRLVRKLID